MPCSDHAVLLKATAQHVCRETACGVPAHVRILQATTQSSAKVVIRSIPISDTGGQCETKQHLSWTRKRVVAAHYKKDDLLSCWTSSSDISGYHVDFHEGHGSGAAWHVWINGTAWARHGRSMLCVNRPLVCHTMMCYWVCVSSNPSYSANCWKKLPTMSKNFEVHFGNGKIVHCMLTAFCVCKYVAFLTAVAF